MTPRELRDEADRLDEAGRATLERGDAMEAAKAFNRAEVCRLAADELERIGAKRLPRRPEKRTLRTMVESEAPRPGSGRPVKNPTLWQKLLAARGSSVRAWALSKDEFDTDNTPQSWVKRGKGGRPVPRLWARRLAAEFEDPRLDDQKHWPHGIRD